MTTQYTFCRTEKKYLLTPEQFQTMLERIDPVMQIDEFGRHTIGSVYYDTPDAYLIRRSLQHPVFKEKLRLRGYCDSEMVFPEIKQKYKGVVYKRRIACMPDDWEKLVGGVLLDGPNVQIQRELQCMFRRYADLRPAAYIGYERSAFAMKDGSELRLTFDENLRARDHHLDPKVMDGCEPILKPGMVVMEIKFPGSAPMWMASLLSECGIRPVSLSKYGTWHQIKAACMKA